MNDFSLYTDDESADEEPDPRARQKPERSPASGSRPRSRIHEPSGLPTSKKTQNLILYRSKATTKRRKSRLSSLSGRDVANPEDGEAIRLPGDESSNSLSVPSMGQLGSLPIKSTALVQRAVQYYTEVYAPFVLSRPQVAGHATDWTLLNSLVPFTLSDPMVLSATVALMEHIQVKGKQSTAGVSKAVMRHSTDAMVHLQTKLASEEERIGNDVMLAILNLAAIELHESSFGRLNIHMQAISRIVELRGGVDNLGFDGYLRHTVLAYQALWQKMRIDHQNPASKITIKYPSHPFSPDLCKQISDLPNGFHEPMLARQFALPLIDTIHYMHTSKQKEEPLSDTKPVGINFEALMQSTATCIQLVRKQELSIFERIVIHGIMAFSIYCDSSKIMYRLLNPFLQVQSLAVLNLGNVLNAEHESQRRCLVWASSVMIATTLAGCWTSKLGHKVLEKAVEGEGQEETLSMCREFFWDDGCTEALLARSRNDSGLEQQDHPSPGVNRRVAHSVRSLGSESKRMR